MLDAEQDGFELLLAFRCLRAAREAAADQAFGGRIGKEARPLLLFTRKAECQILRGTTRFAASMTPLGRAAISRASAATKVFNSVAGMARLSQP